jgi:uncharacterized protein YecE (DUF72 family)
MTGQPDNIRVGTASWTDKSLIDSGRFYPADATSAEDRLRYYASQFPLVEVDSSYYAIPAQQTTHLWAARTPASFRFNIKAFRLFTGHQTSPVVLSKDVRAALPQTGKKNVYYADLPEELRAELWRQFREALLPLRAAGKLVAIHFQFAPWMAFHPENFAHIEACQRELPDDTLAVEFRNQSWFTATHVARTLRFERERNLVNVIVDGPQGFANSVPPVWEVTNPDLAILRLHGRNRETWNKKGLRTSAERFNYDYSSQELTELAAQIKETAPQVQAFHVVLNNNYEDQGQRNARTLIEILKKQ